MDLRQASTTAMVTVSAERWAIRERLARAARSSMKSEPKPAAVCLSSQSLRSWSQARLFPPFDQGCLFPRCVPQMLSPDGHRPDNVAELALAWLSSWCGEPGTLLARAPYNVTGNDVGVVPVLRGQSRWYGRFTAGCVCRCGRPNLFFGVCSCRLWWRRGVDRILHRLFPCRAW